jgi:toxin ParE1/3/4
LKSLNFSANIQSGETRPQVGKDVRVYPAGSYVIYFHARASGAEILRVVHGARDVKSLD